MSMTATSPMPISPITAMLDSPELAVVVLVVVVLAVPVVAPGHVTGYDVYVPSSLKHPVVHPVELVTSVLVAQLPESVQSAPSPDTLM
jgi:hypothetical protein